jgi:hypothetical protein
MIGCRWPGTGERMELMWVTLLPEGLVDNDADRVPSPWYYPHQYAQPSE